VWRSRNDNKDVEPQHQAFITAEIVWSSDERFPFQKAAKRADDGSHVL
jgi:hypothetical protein